MGNLGHKTEPGMRTVAAYEKILQEMMTTRAGIAQNLSEDRGNHSEALSIFRYLVSEDAINESTITTDEERHQAHTQAHRWVDELISKSHTELLSCAADWALGVAQTPLVAATILLSAKS